MTVSYRHLLSQGRVLSALGRTAYLAAWQNVRSAAPPTAELPGPEIHRSIPPLPPDLIDDYLRAVGGDPLSYRDRVPPHLFPQWGVPLAARTLEGLSYPMLRVVNGGCRLSVNDCLAAGRPLEVRARLESIEDDGKRVILQQHIETGSSENPAALVADIFAIVPLGGDKVGKKGKRRLPLRVPAEATSIDTWKLAKTAGLEFAILTGDINPIHWISPYARASGFKDVILHGFASMARTWESLTRRLFDGDVDRLRELDVRFTQPLVLPATVHVYVDGSRVFVGDAHGSPAYLTGTYSTGD